GGAGGQAPPGNGSAGGGSAGRNRGVHAGRWGGFEDKAGGERGGGGGVVSSAMAPSRDSIAGSLTRAEGHPDGERRELRASRERRRRRVGPRPGSARRRSRASSPRRP